MQETQETWVRSLGGEDPLEEEMQPTPAFLLGESHGERSLAGLSPWVCKESDIYLLATWKSVFNLLKSILHTFRPAEGIFQGLYSFKIRL